MLAPKKIDYLQQKLDDVKSYFLLDSFKGELGEYLSWDILDDLQRCYVRAYIALCHAEIESHFEQWATYIIGEALRRWTMEEKISLPLFSLFVHYKFMDAQGAGTNQKVHQIINEFKKSVVERNHGIKEDNIRDLFRPLGVDDGTINSISPALNSFGDKRGEAVHASIQVQRPLDIPTLISEIGYIQQGIRIFENTLEALF